MRNNKERNTPDAVRFSKAVAYVRMSTEHQQYSTQNQLETISIYALEKHLEIIRVYTDSGKSGLKLKGREGLQQLFQDVESDPPDFSTILVYDISRWGRFQDPDVSASYEVRCRQAGVSVQYCAEQFENDGSPYSGIMKSMKRMMAGEYSRELSVKVFAGQTRLIQMGFRQGGMAGFGLRRQLVDQSGKPKGQLEIGELKSIQTDRVILIPGPANEVETVRTIYRDFVEEGRSEHEIAEKLNRSGTLTNLGRCWTRGTIHQILINEKYIGNNVWNRTSFKLKEERIKNPHDAWVRSEDAFGAIVNKILFHAAQAIIQSRSRHWSDDEMLDALKQIFKERGFLSGLIIDETDNCPSSSAFQSRFGSLLRTYELVGYSPTRDFRYIEANRNIRLMHPKILNETIQLIRQSGANVCIDSATEIVKINDEFTVSIVLCRCRESSTKSRRWLVRFDSGLCPD